jgi:predicted nucleic acid-binding protein
MPTLIDSTVFIDILRDRPGAFEYLRDTRRVDAALSVAAVRTEVLGGAFASETRRVIDALGLVLWLDVTVELADMAGALMRRYRPAFAGVDTVDYLLAAAAIEVDGIVATSNVRHFPMFPGLRPPY